MPMSGCFITLSRFLNRRRCWCLDSDCVVHVLFEFEYNEDAKLFNSLSQLHFRLAKLARHFVSAICVTLCCASLHSPTVAAQ